MAESADPIGEAVAAGGTYDLLRERLLTQVGGLEQETSALNAQRETLFGRTAMEVMSRVRVRTENNCVPRDIVRVGDRILFGYNVFLGLKSETKATDVFGAYRLIVADSGIEITAEASCDFLEDERFLRDFRDLYAYYKTAHLARMQVIGPELYVTFRIGEAVDDVRVFHWHIESATSVVYVDDRAERKVPALPQHDFQWQTCGRDNLVAQMGHPAYSLNEQLFVEVREGYLRFKIEDNSEAGAQIFREEVVEPNQTLDDTEIAFAVSSGLMVVRIRPYGEERNRFYLYDSLTESLERHDEVGIATRELPEDHGLIFPGGLALVGTGSRRFEDDVNGLRFTRVFKSPNGEDVLYVFYEAEAGRYGLYAYNLIRKSLENPIYAHGYSLFPDGKLVIFRSETSEPTRNHPMQIWQTSFFDDDHQQEADADSALNKIGNNELVRGISDLLGIVQAARSEQVTMASYNALIQQCTRLRDAYFWLDEGDFQPLGAAVVEIAGTAELVLDEFEKIAEIRAHANKTLASTVEDQVALIREVQTSDWQHAREFVRALGRLRKQRGHLLTIAELRYIDSARVSELEQEVVDVHETLAQSTVSFLLKDDALDPYRNSLEKLGEVLNHAQTAADLAPVDSGLDELGEELDLLTEILGSLSVDDATKRTAILESISELFAGLNAAKAQSRNKGKNLGSGEAKAEFAAQFTLFSQSITNALAQSDTPDACDEQLARLTIALEELEGRFGVFDEFLPDIVTKREELQDAFDTHRQNLLDERQRKAQNLFTAAGRILDGIAKRGERCADVEELNTHFSTDSMVVKFKDAVASLRELDDAVKADDLQSRLKSAQDNAVRSLRDKQDIYEADGAVIRLGQHRFSVNTQSLELTLIPREDGLYAHLTGTGFAERIENPELNEYQAQWQQAVVSETAEVYRGEYLAGEIIHEAGAGVTLTETELAEALLDDQRATKLVRERAAQRYTEGYEKGVHDHDALQILRAIVPRMDVLGLLIYNGDARALATLFWQDYAGTDAGIGIRSRAQTAFHLARLFPGRHPYERLTSELVTALEEFVAAEGFPQDGAISNAAQYLVRELAAVEDHVTLTQHAHDLVDALQNQLHDQNLDKLFAQSLAGVEKVGVRYQIARQWLQALAEAKKPEWVRCVGEAAAYLLLHDKARCLLKTAEVEVQVTGLLGQHARIVDGTLDLAVDEFVTRMTHFREISVPRYSTFQELRHSEAQQLRGELKIEALIPRPLASFVRNKLLDEAYLPIIGDNLAKQLGAADDAKRTDLMGLLLLISPPGYGKTTLMEYVASRLGLIFVKVNGPALGHSVVSVDPEQAPNATARQELEKLNLAFEMSNNVMLYVDDIQHTHPEFLQKFISLCDGTRRIEGVWRGETKTYDLRGRRFCVVMAGNPYTESGDVFQVPDMLANRADVYNLGDVLAGREEIFALSYIENSLTSNPVLAPLATRDMSDVYRFVERAQGATIADSDFEHSYSGAEANEIVTVLKKMQTVQEIVLAVNREYIRSAATAEQFRTEPPFKLQGSYRNMNKLAEKIVPVMNEDEMQALLDDHYAGESQLLTGEAEYNVLRLAELRERMTEEQEQRLQVIRTEFQRAQSVGGADADAGTKLANQLALIRETLAGLGGSDSTHDVGERLNALNETIRQTEVTIVNQPSKVVEEAMRDMARTIETTFMPVVASMNKKIDLDLAILKRVNELNHNVSEDDEPT